MVHGSHRHRAFQKKINSTNMRVSVFSHLLRASAHRGKFSANWRPVYQRTLRTSTADRPSLMSFRLLAEGRAEGVRPLPNYKQKFLRRREPEWSRGEPSGAEGSRGETRRAVTWTFWWPAGARHWEPRGPAFKKGHSQWEQVRPGMSKRHGYSSVEWAARGEEMQETTGKI